MIRFLREYLKILIPLLIGMGVYWLVALPWLEPRANVVVKPIATPISDAKDTPWWSHFFLPGAWQNNNPTVVRTEDGILLFQDWKPLAPDRWSVSPLTIIVPRGKRPMNGQVSADQVLFIENPEGAEIQFQDAFDLAGPPPPVVGGHLSGPVRIVGPNSSTGKEDLWVETRDIHIDRKQLWTSQEVKVKIGSSRITGRDLSIQLDQDLLSNIEAPMAEESPFQGLDQMKLMYVDRVEFDLPKGGMWSPKDVRGAKIPATASMTCQGSFHFDFHSAWAELTNGVQVVHKVDGQLEDHFSADHLRLQLRMRKRQADNSEGSTWTVQRMEAKGMVNGESDRPGWLVQMDAPGIATKAIGRSLNIDLVAGRIELSNQLNLQNAAEASRVYFEREGLRVWSPNLQFESPELAMLAPKVTSDETHVGALLAAGPGTAQLQTQDGDQWKLSWANVLSLQPDEAEDVLTIDGSANASSQKHGRFSSEKMHVWLVRMTDAMKQKYRARYGDAKPNDILADRIHAKGQVQLDSPTLQAQVEDLRVWLVYPYLAAEASGTPLPALPATTTSFSNSRVTLASAQIPMTVTTMRPGLESGALSTREPSPPIAMAAPATPLHVTGPSLRTRIIIEPHRTEIDDLEIEGGVTLIRNEDRARGTLPFTITGEHLKMNTSANGLSDVQIIGAPAEIKMGNGLLTGPEVRFNQRDQLVWMDHPGTLIVPPEILASRESTNPTESIRWLKPPRIDWRGGMNFDGKVARLTGGVEIEADMMTGPDTRWLVYGNSQAMEVQLTRAVQMGTPSSEVNSATQPASELGQILLKKQVDLRGIQSDAAGNRISLERFLLPEELVIDFPTKGLGGRGPGSVLSRRFGKDNELTCMHLVFAGEMAGNFATNELEFRRKVDVLMGPIPNWESVLNVQAISSLGPNQTLLSCDLLRAYSTSDLSWNRQANPSRGQSWELEARDNVIVESRSGQGELKVVAPRIQYASPQDLLRIYGVPHQPGIITMPPTKAGDPPSTFRFSYFEINPRTMSKGAMNLISASTGEVSGIQSVPSPRQPFGPTAQGPNLNPAAGAMGGGNRNATEPSANGLPSPRWNPKPNR